MKKNIEISANMFIVGVTWLTFVLAVVIYGVSSVLITNKVDNIENEIMKDLNPLLEKSKQITNVAEFPIGTIIIFPGSPPDGWLVCDGSPKSKTKYIELSRLLGNTFGHSQNEFSLPDLRGRVPIGAGQGAGGTLRILGEEVGKESHRLTIEELPQHSHELTGVNNINVLFSGAGITSGFNPLQNSGNARPYPINGQKLQILPVGNSKPHSSMQPSLVVNFIIKAK